MFSSLRRAVIDALRSSGARPTEVDAADRQVDVAQVATEPARVRTCELLEGREHAPRPRRPIGSDPTAGVGAFLDGIQQYEVCAWLDAIPVVVARASAVVRATMNRRFVTWRGAPVEHTAVYLPDSHAELLPVGIPLVSFATSRTADDTHPFGVLGTALRSLHARREALESALAADFISTGETRLYIDGQLPRTPMVLESPNAYGVVTSHHTLYISDGLNTILQLAEGERSAALAIDTQGGPPVATWYLRLRTPAGRSPLHGLVRIEAPLPSLGPDIAAGADAVSRDIFAERAPVSLPDRRWDVTAYGIRNCQQYLEARLPPAFAGERWTGLG
ncbi:MAG: hypothetical protein ACT4OZ_10555 [Gemmatimonadota bacterium]